MNRSVARGVVANSLSRHCDLGRSSQRIKARRAPEADYVEVE
jgi:hypothetical protein